MNAKHVLCGMAMVLGSSVATQAAIIPVTVPNGNFQTTSGAGGGGGWFELGVWSTTSASLFRTQTSYDGLTGTNGTRMVNMGLDSVWQTLSVPAVANSTYTLTLDMGRPNNNAGGTFKAMLYDGARFASMIINTPTTNGPAFQATPNWLSYTFTGTTGATVSGNNITLEIDGISGGQGGAANWLDNVSLSYVVIPEPGTFGLLAMSAVGLLAGRRRQRSN